MTPERSSESAQRRPLKNIGLFLFGFAALSILFMFLSDGGDTARGAWAARATLDADDLNKALGGEWKPDRAPVNIETVAGFARPFVTVPDDRAAAAWRDTNSGATVFQATLVYDNETDAINLEDGRAAGLLKQHFGLEEQPLSIEGVGSARRYVDPNGFEAITLRIGPGIVFIGGGGLSLAGDLGPSISGAADGLPELRWTHQGATSPALARLATEAGEALRATLSEAESAARPSE